MACIISKTSKSVLLADFSRVAEAELATLPWQPGQDGTARAIVRDEKGFDRLTARFDSDARFLFNNVERLRWTLKEDCSHYGAIVVDLPEVPSRFQDRLNGAAIAAACETVLLVALTGQITQTALQESIDDVLSSAGASLGGLVLNDRCSPSLGHEFAREARRLARIAPGLSRRLEAFALKNRFLN